MAPGGLGAIADWKITGYTGQMLCRCCALPEWKLIGLLLACYAFLAAALGGAYVELSCAPFACLPFIIFSIRRKCSSICDWRSQYCAMRLIGSAQLE
jgi:hypothetical protein